MRGYLFTIFLALFSVPFGAHAQNSSDFDVRTQCFETLKENMGETTVFTEPLKTLSKIKYSDLDAQFSKNYKSLTSFGIDIDRGDFEMRTYTFGRPTGYVHPPKLPFPVSTKSELWEKPWSEYLIAEEYVIDSKGEKHFIDCAFIQLGAEKPELITREKYLYDGSPISLTKTVPDGAYKASYTESVSFDYEDKPFASWKRLFIYPKATENEYFNKYSVQDAYPAHATNTLKLLSQLNKVEFQTQTTDEQGNTLIKYYAQGANGKLAEMQYPKELSPIVASGIDAKFSLMTYYQAIESKFPVFAERLSFRGTIDFSTFKRLIFLDKNLNTESIALRDTLIDYRGLATYSLNKENAEKGGMVKFSDPRYDNLYEKVNDVDKALKESKEARSLTGVRSEPEQSMFFSYLYVLAGSAVLMLSTLLTFLIMRRKANEVLLEEVIDEVIKD